MLGIVGRLQAPVLNGNDTCLLYFAAMVTCPDPLARAPRAGLDTSQSLRLAPASLQGALVALVTRDTRKLDLDSAQRLTHFPASPLVTISWTRDTDVGLLDGPLWRPFGTGVVVSGSATHPIVSWSRTTGIGHIACFNAGAAQALFGLDLTAIQDRFVPVEQVIGEQFAPLWAALLASDDGGALDLLESHLAPRWRALHGATPLRWLGRHWVERLAWQADQWRRVHSERHVERRIKSFSGRSLREWQSLVKTEGIFFAARDLHEAGRPIDWATLAQDEGFSDQAHMSRTVKRITGFAPGEFAQRFIDDESFWMYRLWV
jgi:AraC-like DNA-binding protein